MSEYLIQGETLTGIADAIRGKTGGTAPVAVSDMAAQIEGIQVGGGDDVLNALIDRSITEISMDIDFIGSYAFQYCSKLTTADFPMVTSTGDGVFKYCDSLTNVNFPLLQYIRDSLFYYCTNLTTVTFPATRSTGDYGFYGGSRLTTADFLVATRVGYDGFNNCSKLTALILRNVDEVCVLANTGAFTSTPIKSGTGYIYVPRALLSDTDATKDYRRATNWSTYAAQFRALEDYTVDGTTTGELDPTKTGT